MPFIPPARTLRRVHAEDLPALLVMITALAAHHADVARVSEATLARDVLGKAPWFRVIVADCGGTLGGYAALTPRGILQFGQRGMDIHHLYVAEAARGQGIGGALIAAALAEARAAGCAFATVGTIPGNLAAQAFYRARGFAPFADDPTRFRMRLDPA